MMNEIEIENETANKTAWEKEDPPETHSKRAVWHRWRTIIVLSGLLLGTSIVVAGGVCGAGLCHSSQPNESDRTKLGVPLIVVPGWSSPIYECGWTGRGNARPRRPAPAL